MRRRENKKKKGKNDSGKVIKSYGKFGYATVTALFV